MNSDFTLRWYTTIALVFFALGVAVSAYFKPHQHTTVLTRPHIISYEDDHIAISLDEEDVSFVAKTSASPERIKLDIERAFIVSEYLRKRLKMMNKES